MPAQGQNLLLGGGRSVCCVPSRSVLLGGGSRLYGSRVWFGGLLEGSYVFCPIRRATGVPWLYPFSRNFIFVILLTDFLPRHASHSLKLLKIREELKSRARNTARQFGGSRVDLQTRPCDLSLCCLVHSHALEKVLTRVYAK